MKENRFKRALVITLIAAGTGLFWCMAAFFLLWGQTAAVKLLPFLLFAVALLLTLPVALIAARKK